MKPENMSQYHPSEMDIKYSVDEINVGVLTKKLFFYEFGAVFLSVAEQCYN